MKKLWKRKVSKQRQKKKHHVYEWEHNSTLFVGNTNVFSPIPETGWNTNPSVHTWGGGGPLGIDISAEKMKQHQPA